MIKFDIGIFRIHIYHTWAVWALPLEIMFYPEINEFRIGVFCFMIGIDWYQRELNI
jgi:hypothetical protein